MLQRDSLADVLPPPPSLPPSRCRTISLFPSGLKWWLFLCQFEPHPHCWPLLIRPGLEGDTMSPSPGPMSPFPSTARFDFSFLSFSGRFASSFIFSSALHVVSGFGVIHRKVFFFFWSLLKMIIKGRDAVFGHVESSMYNLDVCQKCNK